MKIQMSFLILFFLIAASCSDHKRINVTSPDGNIKFVIFSGLTGLKLTGIQYILLNLVQTRVLRCIFYPHNNPGNWPLLRKHKGITNFISLLFRS